MKAGIYIWEGLNQNSEPVYMTYGFQKFIEQLQSDLFNIKLKGSSDQLIFI